MVFQQTAAVEMYVQWDLVGNVQVKCTLYQNFSEKALSLQWKGGHKLWLSS